MGCINTRHDAGRPPQNANANDERPPQNAADNEHSLPRSQTAELSEDVKVQRTETTIFKGKGLYDLTDADIKSLLQDQLEGQTYEVRIVNVYDGDTFTCIYKDTQFVAANCRLLGVDCPELRPRLNTPDRDTIVAAAKSARDFVKRWTGKPEKYTYYAKFGGLEKYKRRLVSITRVAGETVQDLTSALLEKGHGKPYNGVGAKFTLDE